MPSRCRSRISARSSWADAAISCNWKVASGSACVEARKVSPSLRKRLVTPRAVRWLTSWSRSITDCARRFHGGHDNEVLIADVSEQQIAAVAIGAAARQQKVGLDIVEALEIR